ncbi:MAG: hypothetical protein EA353_12690 [Puniceicoccaceae bacterium]|nr:MAG: hypothetical protein EA353_12690 [Puniceicoccaceae bacterium]
MEWHFPNDHDGIIRIEPAKGSSRFVWPYLAPDVGYNQEMRWQYTRPDALAFEENDKSIQNAHRPGHWIIRFNTKVDKDGEIISANYGKFYGRIFINGSFEQPGHPGFAIRDGVIYINPEENERAMEFKSDYNLAKDSLPPAALLLP